LPRGAGRSHRREGEREGLSEGVHIEQGSFALATVASGARRVGRKWTLGRVGG